jgi:hypothetical protein
LIYSYEEHRLLLGQADADRSYQESEDHMLEELMFTMEIARGSLPADAHPVHTIRLYMIERMIARAGG